MTTVFTADAVTFDFVPEKYALKQDLIAAEFSLNIGCDWQSVIDSVYNNTDASADLYIPLEADEALLQAQKPSWTQSSSDIGKSADAPNSLTPLIARQVAQKFVYGIATNCAAATAGGSPTSYYAGDAPNSDSTLSTNVGAQLASCLNTVLSVTSQSSITPGGMNALALDSAKIVNDMTLDVGSYVDVPIGTQSTAKLSKLLNANAFVPVLNRLIAGGGFSTGAIGAPHTTAGGIPQVRHFDQGTTADGSGDFIGDSAQLVFPVVIKFADDETPLMAEADGNTTQDVKDQSTGGSVVSFQLNIIFEKMM
jgi:hypothetical protein